MADLKISALTGATTPLAGTEVLPIVQSSTTVKVSVANLTAGRAVSTGALSVVAADATLDNAYSLKGKLVAGTAVGMMRRNSSDQVAIDEDGYGTVIGFSGFRLQISGGNATLQNGNFVPSTAAKGVNFTANTPAAGMTSQLLNWYEEGTFTPTVGTLTVVGTFSSTGTYTRVGRIVEVRGTLIGSTSIAAGANSTFGGLPFTAAPSFGTGMNSAASATSSLFVNGTDVMFIQAVATTSLIYFSATYTT